MIKASLSNKIIPQNFPYIARYNSKGGSELVVLVFGKSEKNEEILHGIVLDNGTSVNRSIGDPISCRKKGCTYFSGSITLTQ